MKRFLKIMFGAIALIILSGQWLTVNAQEMQLPPIPVDPAVRIGHLDNGLTYYIRHNEKPENRVEFYIAQKVGSIQEEPRQRGLAHFLEHMAFNGTKNFPGNEKGKGIVDWCESHAIKFGTNLNAYTSVDETVYNISNVPTDNTAVLDSCLLILHDWSNYVLLEDEEIDKERGVIREEWRSRNSGLLRVYTDAQETMYPGSKYADCMPIGNIDVVNNFPYQDLRDYYNLWYHPDLQGIIIVGDINVDEMEGKVKALFSEIPKATGKPERIYYPVSDNDAPIIYIGNDKEVSTPNVQIFFKHDATTNEEKESMAYLLQTYMLSMASSMLDERFEEMTQQANPPFNGAGSDYGDYFLSKTKEAFNVTVITKADGIETGLQAALTEIERMKRFGFTASEYERARANYLQRLESAYKERNNTQNANFVNEYVQHFLNNEPIPGIEQEYSIMQQIAPNIPVEAINALVQQQLIPDNNRVVFIAVPESAVDKCPTKEQVLNMLNGMSQLQVEAYVDNVSDEPLVSDIPATGKIVKEETGMYGSTKLTLNNGVQVYIKKTDFKEDEIRMRAVSPGGTTQFDDKDKLEMEVLDDLGSIGGLGNFSQTELTKQLAGKKVTLSASVTSQRETLGGNSSPKDFETMLQLVYLRFQQPRMDADAFESYKTRTKAQLENAKANPLSTINDTISIAMFGHHPRIVMMQPEMVDQINYQRGLDMFADRFADASDFTFFFVGNIDVDAMKPLIAQYLGALPDKQRKEAAIDRKLDILPGTRVKEYAKEMQTPMATTIMVYSGKESYNLRNNVLMDFLTQALDMVFTDEVREKEGGTYGVNSYGSLNKYPHEEAMMQIVYQTDPTKKEKLNTLIDELVKKMAAEGPSSEQMQKVRDYMVKQYNDNQKENSYWISSLDEYYYTGIDFNADYLSIVNSVTADDVKAFATDLIQQGNKVTVVLTTIDN
ncbi:MAG: insulinase family protein [Bacteroidaceae bacterium]|nr:insulinase family protein [Bacteroidaceae bacterium]